jgi:hypothetical protein
MISGIFAYFGFLCFFLRNVAAKYAKDFHYEKKGRERLDWHVV